MRSPDGTRAYVSLVWSIGARIVRSESGLQLCADTAAPDLPSADLLIVPGGPGVRAPRTLSQLATWLRRHHTNFRRIAAVCTGAYALAEAGIVNGRTITTHWAHARDLQRRYPKVRVNEDALFLKDGRFYSSGGVTAGIDLALDLIETHYGPRAAMQAARELVVFLRRTGAQAQFSAPLKLQTAAEETQGRLPLGRQQLGRGSVDKDTRRAGQSERAAILAPLLPRTRNAARELHQSASSGCARTALGQRANVARAAGVAGFRSADVFRRAFERQFGIAPSEYRNRFALKRGRA